MSARYAAAVKSPLVSLFQFMTPAQIADVTSGAPVLDTAACFQALVNYCALMDGIALIPEVNALLGSQIVSQAGVRVMSDCNALLTWNNAANCGWIVKGTGGTGLNIKPVDTRVELPQLVGPNNTSGYTGSAATNVFDLSTFVGNGLTVQDCVWGSYVTQRMIGWGNPVVMTNGAYPCDNNDFDIGTIDLCKTGLYLYSPPGAAAPIGQSKFKFKNIFALTPVLISAAPGTPGVFQCDIEAIQYEVPQAGGSCISILGTGASDMFIRGRAVNGYFPNDSPNGTSTTMRGPLISGDQTTPSGDNGWAAGTRNRFELSLDGFEPAAGNPIATRARGPGSHVQIASPQMITSNTFNSVALSATQGEANYNGGVGGAAIHEFTRVNFTVNALASGASQTFYFYHQRLNADNIMPLGIMEIDNPNDLEIYTANNGTTVPRECKLIVRNATPNAISTTVNLWLRVA